MRIIEANRIATGTVLALVIVAAAVVFDNEKTQQLNLITPFFSGAANLEWGRPWMYDREESERFEALPSREAREAYRFKESENLEPYDYQEVGYVLVAWVARNVFFWQGDLKAVESLQIAVHVAITLAILSVLRTSSSRVLFFLLYGINPLVLYVATFPLYYFWQVLPGALLLPYLFRRDFRYGWWACGGVASLVFLFVVRPTTLLLSLFFGGVLVGRERRPVGVACLGIAIIGALAVSTLTEGPASNPWHSAYIGIGAYPNPYMDSFGDQTAYDLFERKTGIRLHDAIGNNRRDPETWEHYRQVTRQAYLEILKDSPWLLIRNAVLNFFQTFSIGYISESLWMSYLSSFVGFAFCAFLLWKRRFFFVAAISVASIGYALYVPPVPVYMYGSYILLVGAFIDLLRDYPVVDQWIQSSWPGRTFARRP